MGQRPGPQRANEGAGPVESGTGARIGQAAKTADARVLQHRGETSTPEVRRSDFSERGLHWRCLGRGRGEMFTPALPERRAPC